MEKTVIFRLTTGKVEGTWSIRGGSAKKNGVAKFINYYPGADSIFDEDNKDSAVKAEEVTFKYNDVLSDPACEIIVPESNKNLIDYLKAHPYFGVHYRIHDEEELAKETSESYDQIEKALALIKETDETKIRATAIAIFGAEAYGLSPIQCAAKLKEKAVREPNLIISRMESDNFESKYLAALAYFSGFVKDDNLSQAVVWADTEMPIVYIAKGEIGMNKLAEFFQEDQSTTVIQEIGKRLNAQAKKALTSNTDDAKDKEIADLKRKLAEKETSSTPATETKATAEVTETSQEDDAKEDDATESAKKDEEGTMTIEQARAAYLVKFKKEVAVAKKNNLEWIMSALAQ